MSRLIQRAATGPVNPARPGRRERDFRRGTLACWAAWDDDPSEHDWAPEAFRERGTLAEKAAMVGCILDGAVPERAYGCLAAGPVEDLIGHDLLDYVTGSAERRALWERMRALLGGAGGSGRARPTRGRR